LTQIWKLRLGEIFLISLKLRVLKLVSEPGMVVHACNSSTQLRQEDGKLRASMDYIVNFEAIDR
jgi:hypothetical protein